MLLLIALVVASGLLARERRRSRRLRKHIVTLRGRYLSGVLRARMDLAEAHGDVEALRAKLLLSTLRAGDATCAVPDEPPARAVNMRREYWS